jgi:hypothetical protein
MANIDTIIAFSQGKQRFGFMKNDYFLVSGHMYYKGMEWPVAAWTQDAISDEDVACINTDRRGNDTSIVQYVMDELNRLGVKTRPCTLREIKEIIDG